MQSSEPGLQLDPRPKPTPVLPRFLVQEQDTGSYSCTAVNSAGRAVRRLSLSVHTLPTFTRLPGDVTLSWGERLELVCAAAGSPQPRISWTANGQLVTGVWGGGP